MTGEEPAYRGFACPQAGLDRSFLELLVTEHARLTVQALLEAHATQLERDGAGLVRVLSDWPAREATFETVWGMEFGEIYSALALKETDEIERCAAAVALRLHQFGYKGEWELRLPKPASFHFDQWLLPRGDAIHVSAMTEVVSIDTHIADVWHETVFRRAEKGWDSTNAQALPVLAREGIRWIILPSTYVSPASAARLFNDTEVHDFSRALGDGETELLLSSSDSAMGLIAEFANIYLPWVGRIVRALIPLPSRGGIINSSSSSSAPGVICVTNQGHRCVLAEMLVHEATHQYLYVLKRLGPIDDGTDQTLYFSPFRNIDRPILYIVFAYHAFGNVLLFYRTARAHGLSADEPGVHIDQRLDELYEQLGVLEQALRTTKSLTPLGRALWQPLCEQIHRSADSAEKTVMPGLEQK